MRVLSSAFALLLAAAAARAQSAPFTEVQNSKEIKVSGLDVSVTGTFTGDVGGGLDPTTPPAAAAIRVTSSLSLRVFGKDVWLARGRAHSLSWGGNWVPVAVGRYGLDIQQPVDLRTTGVFAIPAIRTESLTITLLGSPVQVTCDCGAGVAWNITAQANYSPALASVQGYMTSYAFLKVGAKASFGAGTVGAVGSGELLSCRLDSALSGSAAGPAGQLRLLVAPNRILIYVYRSTLVPRSEERRYLADVTVPGQSYDLINLNG